MLFQCVNGRIESDHSHRPSVSEVLAGSRRINKSRATLEKKVTASLKKKGYEAEGDSNLYLELEDESVTSGSKDLSGVSNIDLESDHSHRPSVSEVLAGSRRINKSRATLEKKVTASLKKKANHSTPKLWLDISRNPDTQSETYQLSKIKESRATVDKKVTDLIDLISKMTIKSLKMADKKDKIMATPPQPATIFNITCQNFNYNTPPPRRRQILQPQEPRACRLIPKLKNLWVLKKTLADPHRGAQG